MINDKYKSVLCLWSGGLDSTFMVNQFLQKGFCVDTLYTEIVNNVNKTVREKEAIEKLTECFKHFKDSYYLRDHSVYKVEVNFPNSLLFSQLPCFIMGLLMHVKPHHDFVAMGYVMGDDMVSFIPELQRLWKSMSKFLSLEKPPKLIFPILQMPKPSLWNNLPSLLKDNVTWCESVHEEDLCGHCIPCRKMINYDLMRKPRDVEVKETPSLLIHDKVLEVADKIKPPTRKPPRKQNKISDCHTS